MADAVICGAVGRGAWSRRVGGVRVRLIDRVAVKGRKGAISICEFLAPRDALDDTRQELRQIYMDGLCRYGEQDGSGAR